MAPTRTKDARPRTRRRGRHRTATTASDRLRRLLVVVPYVVHHPGVRLQELAHAFDSDEGALMEDLNLLFVSGLPPYGPGDLIDVQIETPLMPMTGKEMGGRLAQAASRTR